MFQVLGFHELPFHNLISSGLVLSLFGVVREIERYLKTHVENILRNIQNKQ